jgi:hypothetical protein
VWAGRRFPRSQRIRAIGSMAALFGCADCMSRNVVGSNPPGRGFFRAFEPGSLRAKQARPCTAALCQPRALNVAPQAIGRGGHRVPRPCARSGQRISRDCSRGPRLFARGERKRVAPCVTRWMFARGERRHEIGRGNPVIVRPGERCRRAGGPARDSFVWAIAAGGARAGQRQIRPRSGRGLAFDPPGRGRSRDAGARDRTGRTRTSIRGPARDA